MKIKYLATAALLFGSIAFVSCGDDKNEDSSNNTDSTQSNPVAEFYIFLENATNEMELFAGRLDRSTSAEQYAEILADYENWQKEIRDKYQTIYEAKEEYLDGLPEEESADLKKSYFETEEALEERMKNAERSINNAQVAEDVEFVD